MKDEAQLEGSFHPSSFIPHPSNWPDSGLTRNTRARGYRCSVPGLAGFTGAALCGARSLITGQDIADCQLPNADWLTHSVEFLPTAKRLR